MKKEINLEEKINIKSETWSDKINKFFNNIEFINLSPDLKEQVAIKVKDGVVTGHIYWIQIFLSSIIATLWLLQNSVAVVIWAMLISPLLRPINGISYSISKGEKSLFWTSFKILIFSILMAISIWFFSVKIVWVSYETEEILARISPNILDLFIAIFSAMLAVLSLWFKRLWWESIAWVAMAASLLPPLEVIWIELYFWNMTWAYWATMLFLANLVSIILVWIVIFRLFGFTPNWWDKQKKSMESFIFIVVVVFIISIPLFQSLVIIREKSVTRKDAKVYLENILKKENSQISISSLEIDLIKEDNITINSVIKLPEWISFYDTFKKQLDFELTKKLGKNVELNIDLIRTANIVSSVTKTSTENKIYDLVTEEFKKNYSKFDLISLEVNKTNSTYYVKFILWVKDQNFDVDTLALLEKKVKENVNAKIEFSYIPLSINKEKKSTTLTEVDNKRLTLKTEFTSYINEKITNWIILRELKVWEISDKKTKINIIFDVESWSIIELTTFLNDLKSFSNSKWVDLEIRFFTYKELSIPVSE